ncbi:MAG: helix-turn-helix domain-containing protein [Oscillospiraceae bacterium]
MLSQRIREARIANHMSQVELAKKLGVSKQSLSNWENDNIQPSVEMLTRMAVQLNVSTDYLLGLDNRLFIEVTDLTLEEISHIQLLIRDLSRNR